MSIHPSLRTSKAAAGARRNVLKRHERIRHLMSSGTWIEGRSVFGLPKIKQTRIKARKAAAKEKEATTTETAAAAKPEAAS
jgi:small basic protein (TIGR04137 family)